MGTCVNHQERGSIGTCSQFEYILTCLFGPIGGLCWRNLGSVVLACATMETDLERRSGPSHSMQVICLTERCKNYHKRWTVFAVKIAPDLLGVPTLFCAECHEEIQVMKRLNNG